jgi:DNA-binding protein HU-beta
MNTDPTLSTMNRSRTMVHIATMINHKRKTMNKSDLVKAIAADTEVSQEKAAKLLDAVTANITNALATGDTVTIVGFGTFRVKDRAARTGRNPKTGETIPIAASKTPQFKAGKGLKDAVM